MTADGTGFRLDGTSSSNTIERNHASGNGSNGIEILSQSNTIIDNVTNNNGNNGIGTNTNLTTISRNTANKNGQLGIFGPAGTLGENNTAKNNGNPAQCEPSSLCA